MEVLSPFDLAELEDEVARKKRVVNNLQDEISTKRLASTKKAAAAAAQVGKRTGQSIGQYRSVMPNDGSVP